MTLDKFTIKAQEAVQAAFAWKTVKNDRGEKEKDDVLGFKINLIPDEEIELHCWGDYGTQLWGQGNDLKYIDDRPALRWWPVCDHPRQ